MLGAIVGPTWDGGDTLFKTTSDGNEEVRMYSQSVDEETGRFLAEAEVKIDRKVMSVTEISDDYIEVVFYGKTSHADSYQLYMNGYSYDPNACLTYFVNMKTGQMHNMTFYTCSIDMVNELTHEVYDHYDSFGSVGSKDGELYLFYQNLVCVNLISLLFHKSFYRIR